MNSFHASASLILVSGVLLAVQAPFNSTLARAVGAAVRALPWWAWAGGLCGALYVAIAAFTVPRLGVATLLTLGVSSHLITAVALDHVGAFGVARQAASDGRLFGSVLVIAGVVCVRKF